MKEVTLKSEKGFYIGDPCLAVTYEEWDKCFKDDSGVEKKFPASSNTYAGDGAFYSDDGYFFAVDSGILACVPLEECDENRVNSCILKNIGRVEDGATAKFISENGVFTIIIDENKTIKIDTSEDDDEMGDNE